MNNRIYLGTRKGLFIWSRKGEEKGEWKQEKVCFLGEPVTMVLPDRRDGMLYAALRLGHFGVKFHASSNGGETWEERKVPVYPGEGEGSPEGSGEEKKKGASLYQIWSLEPGAEDRPGLIWAGTIPGGLFKSTDRGNSWELVTSLWNAPEREKWMGGGYDDPGVHSICIDPRDSNRTILGVSVGGVWTSSDGGSSWACKGKGMRAEYMPPDLAYDPVAQDPHRVVQCPSNPDILWVQHHNGVFYSGDGAENWTEIEKAGPSVFGFAVAVHPGDGRTAWFVPGVKDECRVPPEGKLVVTRTRDAGKTFEVLDKGLPEGPAYDIVYRHGLDIDATGDRLAMGSTTGGFWVSEDQGDAWTCLSAHLPPIYCVRFE